MADDELVDAIQEAEEASPPRRAVIPLKTIVDRIDHLRNSFNGYVAVNYTSTFGIVDPSQITDIGMLVRDRGESIETCNTMRTVYMIVLTHLLKNMYVANDCVHLQQTRSDMLEDELLDMMARRAKEEDGRRCIFTLDSQFENNDYRHGYVVVADGDRVVIMDSLANSGPSPAHVEWARKKHRAIKGKFKKKQVSVFDTRPAIFPEYPLLRGMTSGYASAVAVLLAHLGILDQDDVRLSADLYLHILSYFSEGVRNVRRTLESHDGHPLVCDICTFSPGLVEVNDRSMTLHEVMPGMEGAVNDPVLMRRSRFTPEDVCIMSERVYPMFKKGATFVSAAVSQLQVAVNSAIVAAADNGVVARTASNLALR